MILEIWWQFLTNQRRVSVQNNFWIVFLHLLSNRKNYPYVFSASAAEKVLSIVKYFHGFDITYPSSNFIAPLFMDRFTNHTQKMKFSIEDLVTLTKKILNGKLHFLCKVTKRLRGGTLNKTYTTTRLILLQVNTKTWRSTKNPVSANLGASKVSMGAVLFAQN